MSLPMLIIKLKKKLFSPQQISLMQKSSLIVTILTLFLTVNMSAQRPYEFDFLPKVNGKVKRIYEYSNKAVYNKETKQLDIKEPKWYLLGHNKIYEFNTKQQVTSMTGLRADNTEMGKQVYSYNNQGLLTESKIVKKNSSSNINKYSYNRKNQLIKVEENTDKASPITSVLSYEKGKLRKQAQLDKLGKEKNNILYNYVGDSVIIYNKFYFGRTGKKFTLNKRKLVKEQYNFPNLKRQNEFIGTRYYYTYDKQNNWISKVLTVYYSASKITEYYVVRRQITYYD